MKLAAYVRVSGKEQQKRQTIKMQIAAIQAWARDHGHDLVAWYKDDPCRSAVPVEERPEGGRLLREAPLGHWQGVVVYELDRWGRKPAIIFSPLDQLSEIGIAFLQVNSESDLLTDEGELTFAIKAGVARYEHRKLLKKTRDGRDTIVRLGAWPGGIIPYGYAPITVKKRPYITPSEAEFMPGWSEARVVRTVYHWIAREKLTSHAVAAKLNAMGIPTHTRLPDRPNRKVYDRHGDPIHTAGLWYASTVRKMVSRTIYKGQHAFGRQTKRKDMELIERDMPPLVEPALWQAANDQLARNRTLPRQRQGRRYLLAGKLRCLHCGCGWTGTNRPNGHVVKDGWAYVCSGRKYSKQYWGGQRPCCPNRPVREWVEAVVWEKVRWVLTHHEEVIDLLLAEITQESQGASQWYDEMDTLRRALAELEKKRERAEAAYLAGLMPLDRYRAHGETFAGEERTIRAQIAEYEGKIAGLTQMDEHLEQVGSLLDEITQYLEDEPTWEDKRFIIERLVDRVNVGPAVTRRGERPKLEVVIAWHSFAANEAQEVPTPEGRNSIWFIPSLRLAA